MGTHLLGAYWHPCLRALKAALQMINEKVSGGLAAAGPFIFYHFATEFKASTVLLVHYVPV